MLIDGDKPKVTYHCTIRFLSGYDKVFIESTGSSKTFMLHVGLESFDGDAAAVSRWPCQEIVGMAIKFVVASLRS